MRSASRAASGNPVLAHILIRTRFADRTIEDAYITFALKPDGTIDRMTMRAVSPLADFSFDYHDLLFAPEK